MASRIEYFFFLTALLDCRFWYIIFLYFRTFPRTAEAARCHRELLDVHSPIWFINLSYY